MDLWGRARVSPAAGGVLARRVRLASAGAASQRARPLRDGDRWATYVNENGRAKKTFVTIERVNEREAEVTEGLNENAEVILHPSERVIDGVRVEARPSTT